MEQTPSVSLREFLDARHQQLLDRLDDISAKQDETLARLRQAEIAIAILQWGYGVGVAVVGWVIYKTV